MFDIRRLAVAETLTFQLVDASDTPIFMADNKPATVTIHGPGSKRYAQAQAARQTKAFARMQSGREVKINADEQSRTAAEFLASITDNIDLEYGDFTGREKMLAIYGDTSIGFIAEQVTKKAGDWANFSQGSAKS